MSYFNLFFVKLSFFFSSFRTKVFIWRKDQTVLLEISLCSKLWKSSVEENGSISWFWTLRYDTLFSAKPCVYRGLGRKGTFCSLQCKKNGELSSTNPMTRRLKGAATTLVPIELGTENHKKVTRKVLAAGVAIK